MLINIHTHLPINDEKNNIKNIYSLNIDEYFSIQQSFNQLFTIGIHPWNIVKNYKNQLIELENIIKNNLQNKNFFALGECGLDRSKNCNTPFDLQVELFYEQLKLAQKYNKIAIIHCVRSFPEIIQIRQKFKKIKVIFHGYNGNEQITKELLKNTHNYFSFGRLLLKNTKQQNVVTKIPLTKIFFESDTIHSKSIMTDLYKFAINKLKIADNVEDLSYIIEENFKAIPKITEV